LNAAFHCVLLRLQQHLTVDGMKQGKQKEKTHMTQSKCSRKVSAAVISIAALCFTVTDAAHSQWHPTAPRGETHPMVFDSGMRANRTVEDQVVFAHIVHFEGAAWIRLHMSELRLEGNSRIRYTSLLDGDVQEMDRLEATMWNYTSAYFNGHSVLVELIAAPGTSDNRVTLKQVEIELLDEDVEMSVCGICFGSDDRVPTDEDFAGRVMNVGCSAAVYNAESCIVSAGHCVPGGFTIIQFRVPNSTPGCNWQHPPSIHQYPITNVVWNNGGVGADWAVATTGTSQGLTIYERYGEYRPLADSVPSSGNVDIWGFGYSKTCTLAYTQQLSQGPIVGTPGTEIRHRADTTGGNSGSGILQNDEIIGVVTHCWSPCPTNYNIGTRIDAPAFQNAIQQLCPPIPPEPPVNNECQNSMLVGDGQTSFSNQNATTTGPSEPTHCNFDGDSNIQRDVWFEYTASCTGEVTISLCDGDQPPKGGECFGYCGSQAPGGCWCDNLCDGYGDCCPDVCEDCPELTHCNSQPGECDGICGSQAPSGCWCDDACDFFGDCCDGVCNDCPSLPFCGTAAGGAASTGFDTKLAVYGANCPTSSGSVIACNKDACGALSEVTINATAGETFKIRIGGHDGATGDGVLTITCEPGKDPIECPADLNSDDVVDGADLLILLGQWGSCTGCSGDLNGDNVVDGADLLILLGAWGNCP
jgi:hypothetical protein